MRIDQLRDDVVADGRVRRSVRLRSRVHDRRAELIAPVGALGPLEDASGWMTALLLPAMALGEDLEVDGEVDAGLLARLEDVITVWRTWDPTLGEPRLRAAGAVAVGEPAQGRVGGCCFSRGVDSLYSAVVADPQPRPSALLHLQGVETRHSPATLAEEASRADAAARAIGLPLLVASTDLRTCIDGVRGWGDAHGAVLAGVATLLGGALHSCRIPASYGAGAQVPFGSNPLVDHRFSTAAVAVAHDDVLLGRTGKVFALVRDRSDLLPHLKVCWSEDRADNCGRCPKCLVTMACLLAAGGLDQATQFPDRIDLDALRAVRPVGLHQLLHFTETCRALDVHGTEGEVRAALAAAVRASVRPSLADRLRLAVDRARGRRPTTSAAWHPPVSFDRRYTDEALALLTTGRPDRRLADAPEHPRPGPVLCPPPVDPAR